MGAFLSSKYSLALRNHEFDVKKHFQSWNLMKICGGALVGFAILYCG